MKFEVAIQAFDYPEPHRAKEGDIIVVRPAKGFVGRMERKSLIWIEIEADPQDVRELDQPPVLGLEVAEDGEVVRTYSQDQKRRYRISLARLKQLKPSLDLAKVRDAKIEEQPFMSVDREGRMRSGGTIPLSGGTIEDKAVR